MPEPMNSDLTLHSHCCFLGNDPFGNKLAFHSVSSPSGPSMWLLPFFLLLHAG